VLFAHSVYFEQLIRWWGKCICGTERACQCNRKISVSAILRRHSDCCFGDEVALSNWQERGI